MLVVSILQRQDSNLQSPLLRSSSALVPACKRNSFSLASFLFSTLHEVAHHFVGGHGLSRTAGWVVRVDQGYLRLIELRFMEVLVLNGGYWKVATDAGFSCDESFFR